MAMKNKENRPAPDVAILPGRALPLGCVVDGHGFNFAIFSRHAESIELLLFDADVNPESIALTIPLAAPCHRTGDIWHVRLAGVPAGLCYAWRAHGPYDPTRGHRFNADKVLLDPYAIALVGTDCWDFSQVCGHDLEGEDHTHARSLRDDCAFMPKCFIADPKAFDWQGDCPLQSAWSETIIYETHVRGLTIDASARSDHPGTFLGIIDKIPYLQQLGITAVQLMPIHEFFQHEMTRDNPQTGERLRNYWGYSTVAFFAPKEGYSTRAYPGCQVTEFKTMVRALHRAGIEVILDVVFNHTAEGNHTGPTLNYRGLDNAIYYSLDDDLRFYRNFSGCGNTLNCNHPVVRDHVLECLRYWVVEMHVDGFRFDLASVLGRDAKGHLLANPPLLERIAEDPVLRHVKLIAEAWDAGGAYQVGSFPGQRWSEWNGRYRDDVRRFWRGDRNTAGAFASRLCGSADIYEREGKQPMHSINYVTCHDGFTLNDLVSYASKHNAANGEDNRDGSDANYSANYGAEGSTSDRAIERIRVRQIKNLLATLFLSRGVPMLLGGDEFRRTQRGNNNAYCQDSAISWYDWRLLESNRELFEFTVCMIALRKEHEALRSNRFYTGRELVWFDAAGETPNWSPSLRGFGCGILPVSEAPSLCLLFNPEETAVWYSLPERMRPIRWAVAVDTAAENLDPIRPQRETGTHDRRLLADRSVQVLVEVSKTR